MLVFAKFVYQLVLVAFSAFCMLVMTPLICTPMFLSRCVRVILPLSVVQRSCMRLCEFLGWLWCFLAIFFIDLISGVRWDISGVENIPKNKTCIIVSNHCSWFDIPVVFKAMMSTGIVVRFFIKKPLIFLPFLGQAAWGLDCPFMRRYSRDFLAKNPEKASLDLLATQRACSVFAGRQVFLLNYLEGTRFTEEKSSAQGVPYKNLLRPKAGGVASAIRAMGGQVEGILDLTISYPKKAPTVLKFLSGRPFVAKATLQVLELPDVGLGDYSNDLEVRKNYQGWVNRLWDEKDKKIEEDLSECLV